jgi:hypothetical protein
MGCCNSVEEPNRRQGKILLPSNEQIKRRTIFEQITLAQRELLREKFEQYADKR